MTAHNPRAAKLERLRQRIVKDPRYYILMGGEAEEIQLPNVVQWRHLADMHPMIDVLFGAKGELAKGFDQTDDYYRMQADVVGMSLALQTAKEEGFDFDIAEFESYAEIARDLVPMELEAAWITIYGASMPLVKIHFDQAEAEAAKEGKENLGASKTVTKAKSPRRRSPKASSNSTSPAQSS